MLTCVLAAAVGGLARAEDLAVPPPKTPALVETLPNGVTLVVEEDRRAPLVASVVLLGVGAGSEVPARSGVAHLFEHLMYEGTPAVPGQGYDRALAEAGGDNNAWTDHDATAFHALVPVGAVERLLFLEADRLASLPAHLSEDSLENQLAVVQAEAALTEEAPHARDLDALLAAVYGPGHPYGTPVHGDPERRNRLSLSDARAWGQRATRPPNVTVALVGDLRQEDLLARARAAFGTLQGSNAPTEPAVALPPSRCGRWSFSGATRQDTLYLAWPLGPGLPDQHAAATLLARTLIGGGQGPLAQALPQHTVEAWTWMGQRAGLFVVEVRGTSPLDETEAELAAVWSASVSAAVADPRRLAREQRGLRLSRLRALEDPVARAESLALCVGRGRTPGCDAEDLSAALAVTPPALAALAQTLTLGTATVLGTADLPRHRLSAPELVLWP